MEAHIEAIVRSLVVVAWADGRLADEEAQIIEALICAFNLGESDAERIRRYAERERSLSDVPIADLSADDRRLLLQQAVIVTYADGFQCARERAVLEELADTLRIPKDEADELLAAGKRRAERLATLI